MEAKQLLKLSGFSFKDNTIEQALYLSFWWMTLAIFFVATMILTQFSGITVIGYTMSLFFFGFSYGRHSVLEIRT